eukprot:6484601-Amphidinium_carterae.1
MAPQLRRAVIEAMGPSGDPVLDAAISSGTDEEVRRGWLKGPLCHDDVCSEFGDEWICSRRFAIRQGPKIRLIDDFSISRINSGTSTAEKVELQGVDCLMAACRYWYRQMGRDRQPMLGKCVDLESDSQIAVRDEHYKFAILAVWRPDLGGVRFYSMRAVPFGAVASVYGFLRFSLSFQLILSKIFLVPVTAYFDDFTVLTLFDLLGWRVSSDPKKVHKFSARFSTLGVEVDLGGCMEGEAKVRNTERRVAEIAKVVNDVLDEGSFTPALAASLVGRLSFMDGQHFARLGVACTRVLRRAAASKSKEIPLTTELQKALRWSLDLFKWCPARSIKLRRDSDQVVIFTDGAVEGELGLHCTMGGLAFFPRKQPEFFSGQVPGWLVDSWRSEGREHVIYQTELLPVLIALCFWQESLQGHHLLVFIDNEAARHALVASYASLEGAMRIIWKVAEITARARVKP